VSTQARLLILQEQLHDLHRDHSNPEHMNDATLQAKCRITEALATLVDILVLLELPDVHKTAEGEHVRGDLSTR